ncbi:hypothetical protein [Rhodopirellula europaea]|uniref:hypothetical protein n=1 Tax=Rhodopirellula europaea TaxID=1263866 RepID=UPI003D27C32E|tara:strand:- start:1494 stop:1895 length:402 start_codon:yes stop_codon:yes gene_type:complete
MLEGRHIVEQFAKALDKEDYVMAQSLLSEVCVYECRDNRYQGPTEIIASYQVNGDAAKQFDSVEYQSEVVPQQNGQFCIHFTDRLSHRGHDFTFRCQQIVDVDETGKIACISHCDLPGQVEALSKFKKLALHS